MADDARIAMADDEKIARVKSHQIILTIRNLTEVPLTGPRDWFDSGRVADGNHWANPISPGKDGRCDCYEKDWSTAGCSGFVTYSFYGRELTFAFSNPASGRNKLGVGLGEPKTIWEKMDYHDYKEFYETFTIDNVPFTAICQCTGGSVNIANVTLVHKPF